MIKKNEDKNKGIPSDENELKENEESIPEINKKIIEKQKHLLVQIHGLHLQQKK